MSTDRIPRVAAGAQIYDLSRLTVLLVEDSEFIRSLLVSVLHALRIGTVHACREGGEAIELLRRLTPRRGGRVATCPVDLVISDLFMTPIDGAMLLRWIRRADESPDRFMPFIMISGAVDERHVFECRDLGVTEFLAKPFSVYTVAQKLLAAIDAPRQFVYAPQYFGPDRRRREGEPAGEERRKTSREDIEILYAGRVSQKVRESAKVWYFRLPNRLREKVGGAATGVSEGGYLDPVLLNLADQQVQKLEGDYADWVQRSIHELTLHHQTVVERPELARSAFEKMNRISHELRGQGGIFGYPLITRFGQSLYDYTLLEAKASTVSAQHLELIKAHIDGIRAVLAEKVKGSGGDTGRQLTAALQMAIRKFKA